MNDSIICAGGEVSHQTNHGIYLLGQLKTTSYFSNFVKNKKKLQFLFQHEEWM